MGRAFAEYPKAVYNQKDGSKKVVRNAAEEKALGKEWGAFVKPPPKGKEA